MNGSSVSAQDAESAFPQYSPKFGAGPATSPAPTAEKAARDAWRQTMQSTQKPHQGCAKAVYPGTDWITIPCTTAPPGPASRPPAATPGHARTPAVVGNGNDYAANVSGHMTIATGSFGPIAGLVSETDVQTNKADSFSLQVNTNTFTTSQSKCNTIVGCQGWQQFIFDSSGSVFIQYQLLNYGTTCPTGWSNYYTVDCYINGPATPVPAQLIGALPELSLTGDATNSVDHATLAIGDALYITPDNGNFLGLHGKWNSSEFNVFGFNNGDQAAFNNGVFIEVHVKVNGEPGSMGAISCVGNAGTTGETTNLTLGSICNGVNVNGADQIAFNESSAPTIASLSPRVGPEAGGTKVNVFGTGFLVSNPENEGNDNGTEIAFGSTIVAATCDSTTHCTAEAPRGSGSVFVTAATFTSFGTGILSPPVNQAVFEYQAVPVGTMSPSRGPQSGGTTVTVSGRNLSTAPGGTQFDFGINSVQTPASNVSCRTGSGEGVEEECTFTTPPVNPTVAGPVTVPVTATSGGLTGLIGGFTYTGSEPPPTTCGCASGMKCCPAPDGDGTMCFRASARCPSPPHPVCHCGGEKCCPDPDGGIGFICRPLNGRCPPLQ